VLSKLLHRQRRDDADSVEMLLSHLLQEVSDRLVIGNVRLSWAIGLARNFRWKLDQRAVHGRRQPHIRPEV
jgi:hypothetical protein